LAGVEAGFFDIRLKKRHAIWLKGCLCGNISIRFLFILPKRFFLFSCMYVNSRNHCSHFYLHFMW
jgi:hypothetical protein